MDSELFSLRIPPVTISTERLYDYEACNLNIRLAELDEHLGRKVDLDEELPLATWWALRSTGVAEDRIWSIRVIEPLTAEEKGRICVALLARAAQREVGSRKDARIDLANAWLAGDPDVYRQCYDAYRRSPHLFYYDPAGWIAQAIVHADRGDVRSCVDAAVAGTDKRTRGESAHTRECMQLTEDLNELLSKLAAKL